MNIDLHTHTTASDGTYSPEKLVLAAKKNKVDVLSVTDHDTMDALPVVQALCAEHKIRWISGIEISCHCLGEEVHILAYGLDPQSEKLKVFLQEQLQDRLERLEAMRLKLEKTGIYLSAEDVQRQIHSPSAAGRPHIARALVYKGYSSSLHDAFQHYLGFEKPGYVPRKELPTEKVLDLIRNLGGISVLAHPGHLKNQEILALLFSQGLQGIEAFHPLHKAWQKTHYAKWAEERNLCVTGGSDFHGDKMKGHGALGSVKMPEKYLEKLLESLRSA